MIAIPIYRKNKDIILFVPMSIAELRRKFALTAEYAKTKFNNNEECGNFNEIINLGATKEFTCHLQLTGVIDKKQKEGYLVKVRSYRKTGEEETTVGEHFFAPDTKIEDSAMIFLNETFGYEQGTPEQSEFFSDIAETSTKFKAVIEFMFEAESKKYFDIASLSYDMAFGNKPSEFYYVVDYGVTPDNQFSRLEYVKVSAEKNKYACIRKKIDLVLNDSAEQHYSFSSFERFTDFLVKL